MCSYASLEKKKVLLLHRVEFSQIYVQKTPLSVYCHGFPLNLYVSVNTVKVLLSFVFICSGPAICCVNMFICFPSTNIQLTKIRTSRLEPLHFPTKMRFLLNTFSVKKKLR